MKRIIAIIFSVVSANLCAQEIQYVDSLNYYFTGMVNDYRDAKGLHYIWVDYTLQDYTKNHVFHMVLHGKEGIVHSIEPLAENDTVVYKKIIEGMFGQGKTFVENIAKIENDGKIRTFRELAEAVFTIWTNDDRSRAALLNDQIDFFLVDYGETDDAFFMEFVGISENY